MFNKKIVIKPFDLVDYSTICEVVNKYIKQYQTFRNKLPFEKDMFDLTDTIYNISTQKNAVRIEIENHRKPFWVKVRESRTQYTFEVWFAYN